MILIAMQTPRSIFRFSYNAIVSRLLFGSDGFDLPGENNFQANHIDPYQFLSVIAML